MKQIKTSIIPIEQQFVKIRAPHELDLKAICVFAAAGFFLESDTYWKDLKVLPPGTLNTMDDEGYWLESKPWFKWHYTPRNIDFDQAVAEFTDLFHKICKEQVGDSPVILALSGGLDSRTQAAAFSKLGNKVTSYSYSFQNGYPESGISREIANVCGYDFHEFTIPKGYLWDKIDDLVKINEGYAEFTNPRQMAVLEELKAMTGIFSLGHGGDLYFDKAAPDDLTKEGEVDFLLKKTLKKGGLELGTALWESWGLEGSFETYIRERIKAIVQRLDISNVSASVRAFISTTYVPRWTNVNLKLFSSVHPITIPYFDDRMLEFICGVPEELLADRKIQIAYLKEQTPALAKITWQGQKPYNLYNYHRNKVPYNLPYRIIDKTKRVVQEKMGKKFTERNWELQFLGEGNDAHLQEYLFSKEMDTFIPKEVRTKFYNDFKNKDAVWYSHPVSMLLTLAVWHGSRKD